MGRGVICFAGSAMRRWRGRAFLLLAAAWLSGCAVASPPLAAVVKTPALSNRLQVRVKPVVTSGFFAEDKERWGMDLSAHYTAFEVQVKNQTPKAITFDPGKATLTDQRARVYTPLDEKESIQYYITGGRRSFFTLIPKASKRMDEETQKIIANRMVAGIVPPGGVEDGLLYFKKVHPRYCAEMVLTLPLIVVETREEKKMTFSFSCNP